MTDIPATDLKPPIAERRDHTETHHGLTLTDPYHWLKDQSYPEVDDDDVLAYLRKENEYFNAQMLALQPTVDTLFKEIKGRQVENESSAPLRDGDFFYQSRYQEGKQYRQHIRWRANTQDQIFSLEPPDSGFQLLIDENRLAEDKDYFRLRGPYLDPTHTLQAYSIDDSGAERYTLRIQHIEGGSFFEETIANVTGEVVWAADSKSFFYVVVNEEWRPYQVFRHQLGTQPSDDILIYEEKDDGFFVGIDRTTSRKALLVSTASHTTSEVYFLWLDSPENSLTRFSARQDLHLYDVDHHRDRFVIRTNDNHKNYRIATTSDSKPSKENWQTWLEGTDQRYLTHVIAFEDHVVVSGREDGNDQMFLLGEEGEPEKIEFPESAYSLSFGANIDPNATFLRIEYSSLVTPASTLDYEFSSSELTTRKVQEIPSGYDTSLYTTERLFATARDGARVPVTIAYKNSTPLDGSAPLYMYGYGAYGSSMDPSFRTTIISLLNRGFVYAIAHIRGGAEMGHAWYEAGKLDQRTNTFNDFVDVARFLVKGEYSSAGQIAIAGGSAGGSLMGVAVNEAPELWGAVAAHVPFVDILNTMLDDTLPLTPIEWPEWGNPIEDAEAYRYIQSYSPYDQAKAMDYPPLFVTAGLNDPRVTYWEPAKWVAKIRHLKTDNNTLIFHTEMGAGHGGKSGRFDSLREVAEEYAFILHELEIDTEVD